MRPLEIALVLAGVIGLAALLVRARLPARSWAVRAALALPVPVGLVQLLAEGARWALLPAYAVAIGLVAVGLGAVALRRPPARAGHGSRHRVGPVLGALGLALAVTVGLLAPVPRLPAPTGPYDVGTRTLHWSDPARPELFTADPDDHRELVVQLWYPAVPDPAVPDPAPYLADGAALRPLAELQGLPGPALDHLLLAGTDAVVGAPVAPGRFPLLLFSPGRGGYRQHNTAEAQELASRGYLVAAVDHPYAVSGVTLLDGRVAELDPRMLDDDVLDAWVPYLAADVRAALDRLVELDRADPDGLLTGRIDVDRAGVFGLSMGGEVTAEACRTDPRWLACLPMDVWVLPEVLRDGLDQPTMWITRDAVSMRAEGWGEAYTARTLDTIGRAFDGLAGPGYVVSVRGAFHQDFSDAPLLSPLADPLGVSGPIGAERVHRILCAYTLAFFDRHLRGLPAPLLDRPDPAYPEVELRSRG